MSPSHPDQTAIRETVDKYISGFNQGDERILSQAFHEDARLISVGEAQAVEKLPVANWFERIKSRRTAGESRPPAQAEVLNVDFAGDAATAKVSLTYPTFRYIDYLSLLKTAQGWRIVTKIYSRA